MYVYGHDMDFKGGVLLEVNVDMVGLPDHTMVVDDYDMLLFVLLS